MADLIVTFSSVFPAADSQHSYAPVMRGSKARTESLTMNTTASEQTGTAAQSDEDVVDIYAEADCWVAIGADPDPESSDSRWFMVEGDRIQFGVAAGDHVAVIAAA